MEQGGERDFFFFLENVRCQVTLIFTSDFLHRTANQRLVFGLYICIFIFFSKTKG